MATKTSSIWTVCPSGGTSVGFWIYDQYTCQMRCCRSHLLQACLLCVDCMINKIKPLLGSEVLRSLWEWAIHFSLSKTTGRWQLIHFHWLVFPLCISMPVVIGTDSSQHRRKKLCRNIANKELIDFITVSYMISIFKIERKLTCRTDRTNSWDDVQLPPEP